MASIKDNIIEIKKNIAKVAQENQSIFPTSGLIAVSKFQPKGKIIEAIEANQYIFGENRIQEVQEKWPSIKEEFKDKNIKIHFIGHLQSNKVKLAVELCDSIHTIDSKKLAQKIAEEIHRQNKTLELFIQINTGSEQQKGGIKVDDLEGLLGFCNDIKLKINGLMCIPPVNDYPSPHFALLTKLARKNNLKYLSMGMSEDWSDAIKLGATHIRVGSKIFGSRNHQN